MVRAIVLVSVGAIAGLASAAYFLGAPRAPGGVDAVPQGQPAPSVRDADRTVPVPGLFDAKIAALERADDIAQPLDLENRIGQLLTEPISTRRDTELAALLRRYAETEPRAALALAERLRLDDRALATVLKVWASVEPEAALAELREPRAPVTKRALALALLEVFGVDEAGTQRVAAVLPPAEARGFAIAAIGKRAEHDLAGALAAAQAFAGGTPVAIAAVADVAARLDPLRGLELADTIVGAQLRKRYRERLLDEWAKLDPDGMLAYLETAEIDDIALAIFSFEAAAAAAPERLLAIAERFGPAQRDVAQRAAVDALALLDPVTAYQLVRSLPPSGGRDGLLNRIAVRYAEEDAPAAFAWASTLDPGAPGLDAVLSRLAAEDPLRAVDAVIAEIVDPVAAQRGAVRSVATLLPSTLDAAALTQIADRIARHPDVRVSRQLADVIVLWSRTDARGAAAWVLRSPAGVTPAALQQVASRLALEDPGLAAQSVDRLPEERRAHWIVGTAGGIATNDLARGLTFVERFRDQSVYGNARAAALQAAIGTEPVEVARAIERDPAVLGRLTPAVVAAWSAQDAPAAARWLLAATGIEDPARASAAGRVAERWTASDQGAATRWVLDLPAGAVRDAGLTGLLIGDPSATTLDTSLLGAFGSADARERAIEQAIGVIGGRNPELLPALVRAHIRDPERAEAMLESAARLRALRGASGLTL